MKKKKKKKKKNWIHQSVKKMINLSNPKIIQYSAIFMMFTGTWTIEEVMINSNSQ